MLCLKYCVLRVCDCAVVFVCLSVVVCFWCDLLCDAVWRVCLLFVCVCVLVCAIMCSCVYL